MELDMRKILEKGSRTNQRLTHPSFYLASIHISTSFHHLQYSSQEVSQDYGVEAWK